MVALAVVRFPPRLPRAGHVVVPGGLVIPTGGLAVVASGGFAIVVIAIATLVSVARGAGIMSVVVQLVLTDEGTILFGGWSSIANVVVVRGAFLLPLMSFCRGHGTAASHQQ